MNPLNPLEIPGGIGRSISCRVGALAEMQVKIARQEEYDELLREALIAAVPASLKAYADDTLIIDHLFKYGKSNDKIRFNENGFGNVDDVGAKLKLLAKAWKGTVKIAISTDGNYRVEVWYIAVL